jgi:MADS-box transcription factor
MGDITDPTEQSPPVETNTVAVANGSASDARKRARPTDDDDDDDDDKPGRERRKISISFISDKSRRHITFRYGFGDLEISNG